MSFTKLFNFPHLKLVISFIFFTSGSGRGKFTPGRGINFRTEGARGRSNYEGRSYGRGDFGTRSEYGGRSGARVGSGHGADYQRVDRGSLTSPGTGVPK
jgi:hypothetical protein